MREQRIKPPIGLRPKWLWKEMRKKEIMEAIIRYKDAGKGIDTDWMEEYIELDIEIMQRNG